MFCILHITAQEELTIGGVKLNIFDIGGIRCARQVYVSWKEYLPVLDAVVFLVDANDKDRLQEAKQELDVS